MQKSVRCNEGHALYLSLIARREGIKRGYLSKKTTENSRWNEKYFALHQNVLFYFENEQSTRPTGIYLLEGCTCERMPAPKAPSSGRDSSDKLQHCFLVVFGHDGQKPLELRTNDDEDCAEWVEAIQRASYSTLVVEREVLMQKYIHLAQILETEKVASSQLRTQLEDQHTEIERPSSYVQSFMRGWLCRRKWKLMVQDYICSPHAESMRTRNRIVFSMVEAEAEYVLQLSVLVNCFLRPLRMAASSKKPPVSHDDVSSIFLNSETIMFLHEIFHQGLKARIASWPTLVLADLFDILLPMLNIYQEFVRNHQYSLQVLANCKQNRDFDKLLKQYESKVACEEQMLETFLTYPMFQIPRYIITLHELLAHTPHEHVERKSLEFAKSKLEELSKMMHDEVSDTENIRKNLAIERMIVEGCDVLLDTNQTFVRQGERWMGGAYEVIITVPMPPSLNNAAGQGFSHLEFKVVVEPVNAPSFSVVLLAPSRQEKEVWTSDISQCIDNIRCNGLITMVAFCTPYLIKVDLSDARLQKDDVDICFSKTLNSCKVPQIRYASVERLLERLTDLRFLSIDFLNTFLHTYRIFTTATVVMDKLADIYKKPFTSIPVRSLELFFASSQGPWGCEQLNNKSPRLSRKFSSAPPLCVASLTASPVHSRKLSLSSPVGGVRAGTLDSSPPPTCPRAPLNLSWGPTVLESASLDKFIPEMTTPTEAGDLSPCRSPSTPHHLLHRQPGGPSAEGSRCAMSPASAFAIATAAAGHTGLQGFTSTEKSHDKEFLIRRAATNRVLNVLRHWVSKHAQDFDTNRELKSGVITLLEEVLRDPDLLSQERKATANILSALSQEEPEDSQLKIQDILQLAEYPRAECFESLSAMELAEQITLLDHVVFKSIPYEEFLGQGWMKVNKNEKTPYIMKTSQHFNDMSNLVASQIMTHADANSRASSIEKWLAVADICRCLNNFNGVLEIMSALNRSAIYRLKKTWAKVCKQTKALMDRLQKIVSSEGRFKNLRETLKNCNPPCVPYLGLYLTDLAFIEEGTPNFTEEGLVNFSKMRMISHIIREIRQFQQAPYRIEHQPKVTQFLLDKSLVMDEDTLYELSLKIEPRLPPAN
uniref:Ras protein-specific guanine nucleotide-releasing factor 2a n=1 Tax=Electrophorus electricus TaxID=8005 RepID=A0A4W4H4Y9_ELEEL